MVTVEEMKQYLRIDFSEDDDLIASLISSAKDLCASVARLPKEEFLASEDETTRMAVLYTVAYLYEHREEADHKNLTETVKYLLFPIRKEVF